MEGQERITEWTSRPTDGCKGNRLANDCACGAEGLPAEAYFLKGLPKMTDGMFVVSAA
jgi:hypothetical protein